MRLPLLPAILLAAGCSQEPDPAPAPRATPTVAAPRTLVAADLPQALGAKIAGPQGPDPEFAVIADGQVVAKIVSHVACPPTRTADGDPLPSAETPACDPALAPEGTVYTYVHTITPTAAEPPEATPAPADAEGEAAAPTDVSPPLFRMTRAAPGFKGAVGYDLKQAEAALGARDPITVTLDNGRLVWRVTRGAGWKPGAPVTVWWQTTAPPDGPQQAFRLELDGMSHRVRAPFPAADKAVERNR
jgi:hypothetical protein